MFFHLCGTYLVNHLSAQDQGISVSLLLCDLLRSSCGFVRCNCGIKKRDLLSDASVLVMTNRLKSSLQRKVDQQLNHQQSPTADFVKSLGFKQVEPNHFKKANKVVVLRVQQWQGFALCAKCLQSLSLALLQFQLLVLIV